MWKVQRALWALVGRRARDRPGVVADLLGGLVSLVESRPIPMAIRVRQASAATRGARRDGRWVLRSFSGDVWSALRCWATERGRVR
jgi:hypothetical protein